MIRKKEYPVPLLKVFPIKGVVLYSASEELHNLGDTTTGNAIDDDNDDEEFDGLFD